MNQRIAAIDIGTTKIVAIVGEKNENGKLEILGMGRAVSKGVKRGIVLNIEETANAILTAVENAERDYDYEFSEVFVGIAGQHIRSIKNRGYKYIDTEEITQEDVDFLYNEMNKISIEPGEEIIHIIPQNYIVDNETGVKQPVGMASNRLEGNYHIVIGQISSAKNITKCVQKVNMSINSLILEPLASSDAVLTSDEKEAGVALVDIGGGTTDIAVYFDDIIRHTAVIPFGGNVVTTDIKDGCSILQRQAESLKIQYGSALGEMAAEDKVVTIPGISGREPKEISFKNLACIIQARMEEIIDAVTFEIENSGFSEKLSAGIVVTGGGSLLKHLPQLIKFKTGLDVRLGFPSEHLSESVSKEINQPMYSTSIGLILKGYEILEENGSDRKKMRKTNKLKSGDKTNIISSIKTQLEKIFEDKDEEM
ncbi:cell division protein FtsA [Bacteroidota bacterium]